MPLAEVAKIKAGYAEIEKTESKLKKKFEDEGMDEDEFEKELDAIHKEMEEYLSDFKDIFYYYEGLKGTIGAIGFHPAGMIGSPIDIRSSIGLRYNKKNDGWISSCDMKAVDGLNYVKYDILSLKTLQVIKNTFDILGKPIPRSHEMDWNDSAVFESMAKSPIGLFQFESDSSWQYLKKFGCRSVRDIAFVTAIIRPSCASFRDKAIAREQNVNPNAQIDEVLKDSLGYLTYQEQQISFLQKLCGFTEGEADIIRRAIGKKDPVLLAQWLPKIESGYIENADSPEDKAREEFQQFLKVFMDAVNYSFSYNHAIAYSMITYMTAYLRHHHTIEFITAYLNNATNDEDIIDGTSLAKEYGITIENPKFGKSKAEYSIVGKEIYKGLESVLYISEKCSTALMSISGEKMSFHELCEKALGCKVVNTRQMKVLIKIDFFSEYGEAKKLYEWFIRFEEYRGRKVFKKEGIPAGTEKIIKMHLEKGTPMFKESPSQYGIDSKVILDDIFRLMRNASYSPKERAEHQLSYLGYVQDDDIKSMPIGVVATNKTKNDSWMIQMLDGSKAWYKLKEGCSDLKKGDLIMINLTGMARNGRYTEKIIISYDSLSIDRNKK